MRTQINSTILVILVLISAMLWKAPVYGESEDSHEYKIKAVYIFQFINFINGWEFQKEENKDSNEPIVIGIIGNNPFNDAFEPLMERTIEGRKITIKDFIGFSGLKDKDQEVTHHPDLENIRTCDILFISSSEQKYVDDILNPIRNNNILTISEIPGFLEKGGIINFIIEKNKVLFNINTAAAKRAKLMIRAKLLRLAQEVIEEDEIGKN